MSGMLNGYINSKMVQVKVLLTLSILFSFLNKHEVTDRVLVNLYSNISLCWCSWLIVAFIFIFSGTYRQASWCGVKHSGLEEWGNLKFIISFVAFMVTYLRALFTWLDKEKNIKVTGKVIKELL